MTASENDPWPAPSERSWQMTVLYAVAVTVVGLNSALYFFGVDSLSHPAISVLGIALLLPLYFRDA